MPHVVIEEAGDLQSIYQAFTPIVQRAGTEILKVQEFFLAQNGKDAPLESVAIENGVACTFFVQLKFFRRRRHLRSTPLSLQPFQFRDQFLRTPPGNAAVSN